MVDIMSKIDEQLLMNIWINGLPPVGAECNISFSYGGERQCEITYIGDGVGAYKIKNEEGEVNEYTFSTIDVRFTPIRTEKEKAVEEMTKIISFELEGMGEFGKYTDAAKALYKADYRKK